MAAGTSGRRGGTIVWEVPEGGGTAGWHRAFRLGSVPGGHRARAMEAQSPPELSPRSHCHPAMPRGSRVASPPSGGHPAPGRCQLQLCNACWDGMGWDGFRLVSRGECPPRSGAGAGRLWRVSARVAWRDPGPPGTALAPRRSGLWGQGLCPPGANPTPGLAPNPTPIPKSSRLALCPRLGHVGSASQGGMGGMRWGLVGAGCWPGGSREDTAGWCQGAGGFLGLAGRGRGNEAASARRLTEPSGTGRSRQSGAGDTARAKGFL